MSCSSNEACKLKLRNDIGKKQAELWEFCDSSNSRLMKVVGFSCAAGWIAIILLELFHYCPYCVQLLSL